MSPRCRRLIIWLFFGLCPGFAAGRPSSSSPVVEPAVHSALAAGARVYVIVLLREPGDLGTLRVASSKQVRVRIRELQGRVLRRLGSTVFKPVYRYRNFAALTGWLGADGLARLENDAEVAHVGRDEQGELLLDESRVFVGAAAVTKSFGLTGENVTVAVIDDGLQTTHPDLEDDIASGAFHFLRQGAEVGPGAEGETGHGLAVAGIITAGGKLAGPGVAPDADVLALRVVDANQVTFLSDWAAAVDYVVSVRGDYERLPAINVSLGLDLVRDCPCDQTNVTSRLLQQAFQAARDQRIVSFCAAGNQGVCGHMTRPACVSAAVSVGAVYHTSHGRFPPEGTMEQFLGFGGNCFDASTAPDVPACFSNRGDCLDLFAPGNAIVTPWLEGTTTDDHAEQFRGFGFAGTSAAAPHATAVAALLAERSCLSAERIVAILKETGRATANGCEVDGQAPIVDALAAVSRVIAEHPPCEDCNRNGHPDAEDLAAATSDDCDENGIPDECQSDCNRNGVADACDIAVGDARDCNNNGIPDNCDVRPHDWALAAPERLIRLAADFDLADTFEIVDIDGDGDSDVVGLISRTGHGWTATNDGTGNFSRNPGIPVSIGVPVTAVAPGHFGGDRFTDLAVATTAPDEIRILTGVSVAPAGFFREDRRLPLATSARALASTDLSGDGRVDLVAVLSEANALVVFIASDTESFFESQTYPVGTAPHDVHTVDVNGDGWIDLVAVHQDQLSLLLNRGEGRFGAAAGFLPDIRGGVTTVADFNADGWIDLAIAGSTTSDVEILPGNGVGGFSSGTVYPLWKGPRVTPATSLEAVDLDGDGYTDIAAGLQVVGGISLLLNQAGRDLAPGVLAGSPAPVSRIHGADLDGDQLVDIVLEQPLSPAVLEVLRNLSHRPRSTDCNQNGRPDDCEIREGTLDDENADAVADVCTPLFVRGDCNGDGDVCSGVSDALALLEWLFRGQARPLCLAACDPNGDGGTDLTDAVYGLSFCFGGTAVPVPPFPECGAGNAAGDAVRECRRAPPACR
jgi:subtilisin family serine protease